MREISDYRQILNINNYSAKMKKKSFILFCLSCGSFAISIILALFSKIDMWVLIKDAFTQFGDFISSSLNNVIRLIIMTAIILYFLGFTILSLLFRDRRYYKIFDIVLFVVMALNGIVFIHGSRENNLFTYFSNGFGKPAPLLVVLAFMIIFTVLFALSYTGIRLVFRDNGYKVSVIVDDCHLRTFVTSGKDVISPSKERHQNVYQYRFSNLKPINEKSLRKCLKNLVSEINEKQVLVDPRLFIQIKSSDLFYEGTLDKCIDYGVKTLNGRKVIVVR